MGTTPPSADDPRDTAHEGMERRRKQRNCSMGQSERGTMGTTLTHSGRFWDQLMQRLVLFRRGTETTGGFRNFEGVEDGVCQPGPLSIYRKCT